MAVHSFRIFGRFCKLAVVLALACGSAFAASGPDESLLGAYDAYRAGDALGFAKHAKRLDNHVLAPWVEYWRLSLRLEDASPKDVHAFFSRHTGSYASERLLRPEWLKVLGKRADWEQFERELGAFSGDDLEIRCYAWSARLAQEDETALAEAAAISSSLGR